MTEAESPGTLAVLGASEDDQLRGTIGQENSPRSLNPQPPRLRVGDDASCDACGTPLAPKPGSRRQRYCGSACRQAAYRARKRAGRCETPRVTISRLARPTPLELVGHGHRWPSARRIEIAAIIDIVEREIGGGR
jgi:hypothetical protein